MRGKPTIIKKWIDWINPPASPVSSHQSSRNSYGTKTALLEQQLYPKSCCWPYSKIQEPAVFCRPADKPQPYLTSISFPTFTPVSSRWPRNRRNPLVSAGYTSSCLKSKQARERLAESRVPVRILVSSAIYDLGL